MANIPNCLHRPHLVEQPIFIYDRCCCCLVNLNHFFAHSFFFWLAYRELALFHFIRSSERNILMKDFPAKETNEKSLDKLRIMNSNYNQQQQKTNLIWLSK